MDIFKEVMSGNTGHVEKYILDGYDINIINNWNIILNKIK